MESPVALLTSLRALPGYEWDLDTPPYHSSFGNWHFYGTQITLKSSSTPVSEQSPFPSTPRTHPSPSRSISDLSPKLDDLTVPSNDSLPTTTSLDSAVPKTLRKVIARVSRHVLRLEREFQLLKQILTREEENATHFICPIELIKIAPSSHDNSGLAISIFESPGPNYLRELVYLGAGVYKSVQNGEKWEPTPIIPSKSETTLSQFLSFALGATTCLEILHHQNRMVHGEIRGDVFHFQEESGLVKMMNFGSGARSFENGLSSTGWSSLNREAGIEYKLCFISPEQTGRLPAQPDGRTDIYSLGILFWSILMGEPPFQGETPLVIMQNVLSRRIPLVTSKRLDVPESLAAILAKMTQKDIDGRYNSVTGLKYDLLNIQRLLDEGDLRGLQNFQIATKDVSSYFTLPSHQIGRKEERDQILRIMDECCANRKYLQRNSKAIVSNSSSSARLSSPVADELESVSEGSLKIASRPGSDPEVGQRSTEGSLQKSLDAAEPVSPDVEFSYTGSSGLRRTFSVKQHTPFDDRSSTSGSTYATPSNAIMDGGVELFRKASKKRRHGHCAVISVSGSAGLGKTILLQSLQTSARSYGYFASAKFDQTKRIPFEPILKVLSSLFRQIFSEPNLSTEFHNIIRKQVGPVWGQLHHYLHLPPWLLNSVPKGSVTLNAKGQDFVAHPSNARQKESTSSNHSRAPGSIATDWLRTGGTAKASGFMNLFVGVLRVIASMKFMCFCVDDLQFADAESLELLTGIVTQNIPLLLVLTARGEDRMHQKAKVLLTKSVKINLNPFSDEETTEYVAATIHRSKEYILPLVALIQEKSGGNPFFVREILETCYRSKCIYYSWKESAWEYDLDKIFQEFMSDGYGSQINNDFVNRRLQELPSVSRALLAWASVIGGTFPFSMVKLLMDGSCAGNSTLNMVPMLKSEDIVAGLQSALVSFIIMPANDEDWFRFSHDRYMQSARALTECYNKTEMHYTIARTILDPQYQDAPWLTAMDIHQKIQHISLSLDLLRERVPERYEYRQHLYEAAENALESDARSIAGVCLSHALALLQNNPWDERCPDVSYQETLRLYIKAAENYWYQSNFDKAMSVIVSIKEHAKSTVDLAPCWIIESRIYARQGNNMKGFETLRTAVKRLGIELPNLTMDECDKEFWNILPELQNLVRVKPLMSSSATDQNLEVLGLLMVELLSTAFWSSSLLFYQASLAMVRLHLERGPYPQCGLAHLNLAAVVISKHGLVDLGIQLTDLSITLTDMFQDDCYTVGRCLSLHTMFIYHLQNKIIWPLEQLSEAWSASMAAGDRTNLLLNLGISAVYRIWTSQDLAETETFVQDASNQFLDWSEDVRGGALLTSVRQFARALQGKTEYVSPSRIFDDEFHNSNEYLEFLISKSSNAEHQQYAYWTMKHIALFLFGHYKEALVLGERLAEISDLWLSTYHVYQNMFYLCLSYFECLREHPENAEREAILDKIASCKKTLQNISTVDDINFKAQLLVIDAETCSVIGDAQHALMYYEQALEHCQMHEFITNEALVLELYANAMMRLGSKRLSKRLLLESQTVYRGISAHGKVQHIQEVYQLVFADKRSMGTAEASCQTDIIDTGNTPFKLQQHEDEATRGLGIETTADRTNAWIGPGRAPHITNTLDSGSRALPTDQSGNNQQDFSAMGLDMIDLASILESSQILSSELQIDKLMGKMAEIITEISAADLVGIVVKDDRREWSLSALGTPDGVVTYPDGIDMNTADVDKQLALQVTVYTLRFKETVFLHNLLEDERFSRVSPAYLEQNPSGKAVICLPIMHGGDDLLGAIYVEGPPNKFTERNLTVLRLLVNQISISLANALFLKKIEKVRAENMAMISAQRKALARAREAENKAREAEAQAIRNMHLKEEAARAKTMFLANISHELRTPLNGVIGMSELLKATSLTLNQAEYADSIRICADTLLSVINDLLDFTKLDAGKMAMKLVPTSLSQTISEVVRALSFQNNEKGLETVVELELDQGLLIIGDPVRLHQVLMNLLSNSYKFTQKGTVIVKAVSRKETKDNITITVTVTDTGIGIPEEHRKKLFQPFTQVDNNSSRTFQGTGLGLSICKRLVENLMGGHIWLDSVPNVGTTVGFTITFRKAEPRDVRQRPMSPRSPIETADRSLTIQTGSLENVSEAPKLSIFRNISLVPRDELRIAVAEDNIINQKIAIAYVERLGYYCEAFGDGRKTIDALELAQKHGLPFHVVLMDVQMPNLDGYDATREIRRHSDPTIRNILIIAMTASAIQGDREKCLDAGMNDYLAKPVRPNTLKALLEAYIDPTSNKNVPRTYEELKRTV